MDGVIIQASVIILENLNDCCWMAEESCQKNASGPDMGLEAREYSDIKNGIPMHRRVNIV